MSREDATRPSDSIDGDQPGADPRFDDWPLTDDAYAGATLVGTTTDRTPVYHQEGRIFRGEPDPETERVSPVPDTERRLDPGETIGDVVAEIGETLGWDSLSSFGESHRREE